MVSYQLTSALRRMSCVRLLLTRRVTTKSKPSNDECSLPLILQRLGVDLSDALTMQQINSFRKQPIPSADANALSALRRCRLFNSARLYANVLQSYSSNIPPVIHLELCRLLAVFHLEGVTNEQDTNLFNFLQSTIHKSPPPIRPTASALLRSCSTLNDVPNLPSNIIERNDVIACLLGRTLRDGNTKIFSSMLQSETTYPVFHSDAVLKLMKSKVHKSPLLAELLLQRCVDERTSPSSPLFLQIIRASKAWQVSKRVNISEKGICNICNYQLNERDELSDDEHAKLHKALLSYLLDKSQQFSSCSPAEVRALQEHVRRLPKDSDKISKYLVVDTLNLIHGRPFEPFYKMLLRLLEQFQCIMLITRPGLNNRYIRELTKLRISIFVCDKLSEDDLFVLLAALEIGPKCYVLTNDQFCDHRSRIGANPDLIHLFDRWIATRVVRYFASTYRHKMPGKFICFPHRTTKGFHVPLARVISQSIYEHDWICLRRRKPMPNT